MVEMGASVSLPCRANMADMVTWTDSTGGDLGNVDRLHVSDLGDLVITRVTWSDMGQYTCTVTNTVGRDAIQTFLYPLASSSALGQLR